MSAGLVLFENLVDHNRDTAEAFGLVGSVGNQATHEDVLIKNHDQPPSQYPGQLTSDALGVKEGTAFEIQIAGERIYIPPHPVIEFEYERDED